MPLYRSGKNRSESPQERFWKDDFGTAYARRNQNLAELRVPFFRGLLGRTGPLLSACELGANIGENLQALRTLSPDMKLTGVEINSFACSQLSRIEGVQGWQGAIQDYTPNETFELVFTCGVLIHINPGDLPQIYGQMFRLSRRFILINEYFNPVPQEITYRGEPERLYKRDFAGEFLDLHGPGLEVVDYGFLWKRLEPAWDNTTWTLFRKF